MKRIFLGTALFLFTLNSAALAAADIPSDVAKAVSDTTRPAKDRDRDVLRLPAETIAFAGVKPGMVVGELFPGGGYFTLMLSDVVGTAGKVYGIEDPRLVSIAEESKLSQLPGHANVTIVSAPIYGQFSVPEKLDMFWITQNYHDLHIVEYGKVDMADFNRRVFEALKPGGTYFILDHAANPGTSEDAIAKLHRIEKTQIIREVTAAGFKLVAEGDALHRPADDHTKSIFDDAIKGHTDQYMLKFQKP